MTGPACSSHVLIVGQPHAFIRIPRQVIHRQLSHSWKTFYFQSSDQLFSWLGGQLDFRCSPTCAWKPEANQCGFASASSALEESRPIIAEAAYVWVGIRHCRSFSAHSHAPRASFGAWLAAKNSLGRVASFTGVSYTSSWIILWHNQHNIFVYLTNHQRAIGSLPGTLSKMLMPFLGAPQTFIHCGPGGACIENCQSNPTQILFIEGVFMTDANDPSSSQKHNLALMFFTWYPNILFIIESF
ncbi:hypothetical protein O181_058070 [Austropuccinia psidii MF-1]|uniref:Uncharacterized protein n=1 Tax=Austropuccinia psidii MF-1 TaxID=1389203 RepID=A0A9Q3E8Z2_9BASI|nr:hypothetical protein [Austropuccinia psidii MF-1]